MKIEITDLEFIEYYSRAKVKFYECVSSKDNDYLKNELAIPLNLLTLQESTIRIVLSKQISDSYFLEITLLLYHTSSLIGKYIYTEDKSGNPLEDSLVFY